MTERKFTRNLKSRGMAQVLRESVSKVIHQDLINSKPIIVDPIDFEGFVLKNQTLIQNDSQRELILYPNDDISEIILPRRFRTVKAGLPVVEKTQNGPETDRKDKEVAGNLLTRQALKTYDGANLMIFYKYSVYGGNCGDLPRTQQEILKEESYEIDADSERVEERAHHDSITKQGYLLKGADTTDSVFAHIGSKSFKRRYCYLRSQIDGCYILELHKDEKQCDAKNTIVMDFCTEVLQNPRKGRFCFELKMTEGHKSVTFAAEDDVEMEDWIKKLSSVLQQNKIQEDRYILLKEKVPQPSNAYGTLKGLEQSMNPQLLKYSRETELTIAAARKENRKRLFGIIANQFSKSPSQPKVEPYREVFGKRIFMKFESVKFRLQAPLDESENLCQIEPYITSVALFDLKAGRKLSESFYFDLNETHAREMLHVDDQDFSLNENDAECSNEWISYPKQALFNVTNPHPDIFVVIRIEKILQGNINASTEPYLKAQKEPKLGCKTLKIIKQYSQKLKQRSLITTMPWAFSAKPLFRLYSSELDTDGEFPAIFKQDCNKLKDEEILKLLNDFRKPEKVTKLTVIPGSISVKISSLESVLPKNCLNPSLLPIHPFPSPPQEEPTFEIAEFTGSSERDLHPYTTFINHLYVYPISLSFENQKIFSRARNIGVTVEIRVSDDLETKPLNCIYRRPGQYKRNLVSRLSCPVLHHQTSPSWYEEIKIQLPLHITPQHHLLFSFYHISCDIKKKEVSNSLETSVGYAWLPLLKKGKLNIEEQLLPVAASLPSGYLSIQALGLGKGNSGPDVTFIENQKPIFLVNFRLNSSIFTTDQHLHNLFAHAERLVEGSKGPIPSDSETCKILKACHAIDIKSVINFLPTLFDILFILLLHSATEEISCNIIRLLINLIYMVAEEAQRKELILTYVKYNFKTPSLSSNVSAGKTVHGEILAYLPSLLCPKNTDFLLVNKFMKFSSIIFDIIIKSMAHHLISSGRIRMHRNERFSKDFETRVENIFHALIPYLITRHKELPFETNLLNKSLSVFVKRCLSLMNRGFVFKIIRLYMEKYTPGDMRVQQEFKFNFVQEVCSHEHYIQLNLPFMLHPNNKTSDVLQQFCLSEVFCSQHFLAGLLIQEVKSSLNEVNHIRRLALNILKNQMAKHDLDERYQSKGQLNRIAMLYVPWLGIVIDNLNRIPDGQETLGHNRISSNCSYVFSRERTPKILSQVSTPTPSTHSSSINNSVNNTPKSKRFTLSFENNPLRASMHLKDMNYLAAIAGQQVPLKNGASSSSLNSDCSSMSQETTVVMVRNGDDDMASYHYGHNRSISMTQSVVPRTDKFSANETKDMLICFIFIIKHLSKDHMIIWWHNCMEKETVSFFQVLELCLIVFRYMGKKNSQLNDDSKHPKTNKSSTLPAKIPLSESNQSNLSNTNESGTMNHQNREDLVEETVKFQRILQQSNLATEVGMVILDCVSLYSENFKDSMIESTVLPKIAQIYLRFLQLGQSETLFSHVFAALRAFINNFSQTLFKGTALLCGTFVYELLKCSDSRLQSVRHEAAAALYLLMRSNYEFSGRKGINRVHLQTIISVSQMIGNVKGLNNARFQESLSLINSYANSDKAMKGTTFPMEVKDLTKRVRTVLMATSQMQAHQTDPERLIALQLSLANSYASTPELRHTWLVTVARNHEINGNLSEAACCHLHISALMSEYLKLKGKITWGAESFAKISKNIPIAEKGLILDSGSQEASVYSETIFLDQLKNCADFLDRSERLECLGELYRLIIPILETKRDYSGLVQSYEHLAQAYQRIMEFSRTGKRLLGRFYRVICYGKMFFEDEHGIEYIFKEPKVTSLSEISFRLKKQFEDKFGTNVVKILMDSKVNVNELDLKMAYIQITHVTPYFLKDELETRQTDFEQNHDIDTFMFETPFTKNGGVRSTEVEHQWKRRTILTTQFTFPYVLKRIAVKTRQVVELSPIEVAIDSMLAKISELEEVVLSQTQTIDIKKLQLRLQGSLAPQVNAGCLSYAYAFLDPKHSEKYDYDKIEDLKDVFRDFVKICYSALQINGRLIQGDQEEYHNSLKENFSSICLSLNDVIGESLISLDDDNPHAHRNSLALFSAISGTPTNSSTA